MFSNTIQNQNHLLCLENQLYFLFPFFWALQLPPTHKHTHVTCSLRLQFVSSHGKIVKLRARLLLSYYCPSAGKESPFRGVIHKHVPSPLVAWKAQVGIISEGSEKERKLWKWQGGWLPFLIVEPLCWGCNGRYSLGMAKFGCEIIWVRV